MDRLWVIVTAPIHGRGSIGEQFNASFNAKFLQTVQMKKQLIYILDGLRVSTFLYFLGELFTIHHEMKINNLYFIEYFSVYYKLFIHVHHYFYT